MTDRLAMRLAWLLPRSVVMWCAYRVAAHATQGQWGGECPDYVSVMTMLKRWDKP